MCEVGEILVGVIFALKQLQRECNAHFNAGGGRGWHLQGVFGGLQGAVLSIAWRGALFMAQRGVLAACMGALALRSVRAYVPFLTGAGSLFPPHFALRIWLVLTAPGADRAAGVGGRGAACHLHPQNTAGHWR